VALTAPNITLGSLNRISKENAKMSSTATTLASADGFTQEQVELIKKQIMPGASNDELKLFCHVANKMGLDPFARQIYPVKRSVYNKDRQSYEDKWAYQTSIDGFRLIALRSGEYEGQTQYEWCGKDGKWTSLWTGAEAPFAARVGVHRKGFKEPAYGVARWDAYCQTSKSGQPTPMWAKMGDHMLAKCAEALAFRKAFPQELSGIYTDDEMAQAENAQRSGVTPTTFLKDDIDAGMIQQEEGVRIPYGPLAQQMVHKADPLKLRAFIDEIEAKAKRLGKPVPNWALPVIEAAEPIIAKLENGVGSPEEWPEE
jgi:phage recombination protein Bet